jgi:hypothetical protein
MSPTHGSRHAVAREINTACKSKKNSMILALLAYRSTTGIIIATLAQQKPRELLTGAAQRVHRVQARSYQITHRLVSGFGNPDRRQGARPTHPCEAGCSRRLVLTRSPARFGISDGATTTDSCPFADS